MGQGETGWGGGGGGGGGQRGEGDTRVLMPSFIFGLTPSRTTASNGPEAPALSA